MKKIIAISCFVFAMTAHAQYGQEYDEYGIPQYRSQTREPYTPNLDELREWGEREQRRYEQNLPAIREREGRQACDAIQGNDAARADCYRGLGGW